VRILRKSGRGLFIGADRREMPNDLVVSVASATARGNPNQQLTQPCGHFGYLDEPEAFDAVLKAL
jgi:hypothetical protein